MNFPYQDGKPKYPSSVQAPHKTTVAGSGKTPPQSPHGLGNNTSGRLKVMLHTVARRPLRAHRKIPKKKILNFHH